MQLGLQSVVLLHEALEDEEGPHIRGGLSVRIAPGLWPMCSSSLVDVRSHSYEIWCVGYVRTHNSSAERACMCTGSPVEQHADASEVNMLRIP